ncbi:hypothetical protein KKG52_03120 [Patescibacteria group bacterium]|nr:hypothetical protein [Patescibacteria group bacterium]
MSYYLTLPFVFLKFWFLEAPVSLVRFLYSLNGAFLDLVSLPFLIKSFFKPWKNEYRKGLVGFSIGMGMFVKSIFIIVDLILFIFLITFEVFVFILFLLWPILTLLVLFK